MHFWKKLLLISLLPIAYSYGQSTYLPEGAREQPFIDRMQIRSGSLSPTLFSAVKPYARAYVVQEMAELDSLYKKSHRSGLLQSSTDFYQHALLQYGNSEWSRWPADSFIAKRPISHTFYTGKINFYEAKTKDYFIALNPMLQIRMGLDSKDQQRLYMNARGVSVRGLLFNKLGFSSTIMEHQERGPAFFQQWVGEYRAVPGVGFYKDFKNDTGSKDYFDARGSIYFNVMKGIDLQFGYDKNFIGNGYRSLYLSDWGNSNLFLKLNTKVGKFNYQNLFMELMPQFRKKGDTLLSRKYAAMHHLSVNVNRWLNVGFFEGIIFGRKDHFDYAYMNPIIFYRHIEGTLGSPDNALAGFDIKAQPLAGIQLYGQFIMDEFIASRIFKSPTNWTNKFGFQLGGKYVDAFGIKNLDLQVEMNRVRPFTYSHSDSIANYTHYNQPLAHPLGANFQEWIGLIRYQPVPKWTIDGRIIYYEKGMDTANSNFGGNIFKSYRTREGDVGFSTTNGVRGSCLNATIDITYEFKYNLFFDAGAQYRTYKLAIVEDKTMSLNYYLGIRLNFNKRKYDF